MRLIDDVNFSNNRCRRLIAITKLVGSLTYRERIEPYLSCRGLQRHKILQLENQEKNPFKHLRCYHDSTHAEFCYTNRFRVSLLRREWVSYANFHVLTSLQCS